jgi:hypothetical protein
LQFARILPYSQSVTSWQPLQFTAWEGTYVFMLFVGAITIYETRRDKPILRAISVVLGLCIAFAVGQMAGFHIGQQADEWAAVTFGVVLVSGVLVGMCQIFSPDRSEKRPDD